MLAILIEEEVDGNAYATTSILSGGVTDTNSAGTAKEMPIFWSETFGGGHTEKVQEGPARETEVLSGHRNVSSGQVAGCIGCSTAFL